MTTPMAASAMHDFSVLYAELDATTATNRKLAAMKEYFSRAAPADAAWAVYFLAGGKPRQTVPTRLLRQFAIERSALDEWLFDECYDAVGDLAETIAHILPPHSHETRLGLAAWMEQRIAPLRGAQPDVIRQALFSAWDELDWRGRFLLTKLISGGFRVGVSRLLVTRALADLAQIDSKLVAQRLMGWSDGRAQPSAQGYLQLIAASEPGQQGGNEPQGGQPYPFFLAHPLQAEPQTLGPISDWLVEWKYDGIRAQLVRRNGHACVWSRGEDLITDRFPELSQIALPDGTVIDGEILVWHGERPAAFAELQKRIGRKTLTPRLLQELPVVLLAYDVIEHGGQDIRTTPQAVRRKLLEQLVEHAASPQLRLSPVVQAPDWNALAVLRESSRERAVEGMMIKANSAHYGVGRTRESGVWWKWKIDPYSVDAVLIYAQPGNGRRASLYTDYTFAVWDEAADGSRTLVPFAKAYSGLTDAEIRQVDAVVRRTTIDKFGPVRSVTPSLVFEIGFEGIARSPRHKAGIAVRFPRMLRRREDKKPEDADTLQSLRALLA
ncbi:MAG: ATP-dependent ligase [Paucimonas sp.]|nr:ATP-dependent ligase [Paucimonas sp.]